MYLTISREQAKGRANGENKADDNSTESSQLHDKATCDLDAWRQGKAALGTSYENLHNGCKADDNDGHHKSVSSLNRVS